MKYLIFLLAPLLIAAGTDDRARGVSAVGASGVASTDIDLNGNDLIMNADGTCYWKDAGTNFVSWHCGSSSVEFYLTTTGITFNGGVGHLRMGQAQIKSLSGALQLGGSCTPSIVGIGDICVPNDLEIQGALYVNGAQVGSAPDNKSYAGLSGAAGTDYLAGYYFAALTDENLTQASTTATLGTANVGYAAHAMLTAAAAGTATGGSGAVTVVVSGTSINEITGATASDSEVLVADITAAATDTTYETVKKWLGTVTYTLTVGATGHTAYALDFNPTLAKYDDRGDNDFTITGAECVTQGAAAESALDIVLYHHSTADWTYSAAAFVPGGTVLVSSGTDHGVDNNLVDEQYGAFKRVGMSTAVTGSGAEGYLIGYTTAVNNSVGIINCHVDVTYQ